MKPTTRSKTTKIENAENIVTEVALDECQRQQRIAAAAYFRAESRGFAPGGELDDWLVAEKEFAAAGGLARMAVG